jgi:hypothetical protein
LDEMTATTEFNRSTEQIPRNAFAGLAEQPTIEGAAKEL